MRKDNGFTLVELMVAMTILALFIGTALYVGKSAVARSKFTNAVNQFVADYNYARMLAVRENRYVAFNFSSDGTSYTLKIQDTIGDFSEANFKEVEKGEYILVGGKKHWYVSPMDGEAFFDPGAATNFAVNAMGIVRGYPVVWNAPPATIRLSLYIKNQESEYDEKIHTQNLTIYPTGGIRFK